MSTSSELWPKLARSKKYREEFVSAHVKQAIPFQIRALMKQLGLSQKELASRADLTQGAISRAADPDYGNLTINTLVRIAAGFDVAFVGRFVPFGDLPPWFDRLYEGKGFYVETFAQEDARRRAPAVATADLAISHPEITQSVASAPQTDIAAPMSQDVPESFVAQVEQARGDDERLQQILDAVPLAMLRYDIPARSQEGAREFAYGG